jgi:hypothetical protein
MRLRHPNRELEIGDMIVHVIEWAYILQIGYARCLVLDTDDTSKACQDKDLREEILKVWPNRLGLGHEQKHNK